MDESYYEGGEEYYESTGAMGAPGEENETVALFRDLENELQILTQRHHVPPEDLSQLFQVVQGMFDIMDSNRESLDRLESEKNELEDLWKAEKDKLRAVQRRKLELECRLEEERMQIESEKTTLQKEKVVLLTKVKQIGEQKEDAEEELQRIKERTVKEDIIRKDLLEQYKKQADIVRTQSLKRKSGGGQRRRKLPTPGERRGSILDARESIPSDQLEQLEASIKSVESYQSGGSETALEVDETPVTTPTIITTPPRPPALSLQEELTTAQADHMSEGEDSLSSSSGGYHGGMTEEMMDLWSTPMRAEVEMLQQEKHLWAEEREKLQQTIRAIKADKEHLESQNGETQVEVRQLRENLRKLQEEMADVKTERDEILGHYLEQPFDEYCITRKELNELLKKHQKTAIDLETEREEKERLKKLLASKKGFMERMRERMRRMFSKPVSNEPVLYETGMQLEKIRTPSPLPVPLVRCLSPIIDLSLKVERGWLMARDCRVSKDILPQWVGQITLQGMDTDMIDDMAVGRVYHSQVQTFPGSMTPPRMRVGGRRNSDLAFKLLAGLQQLRAEVWVATSEVSAAHIEIIDVLSKPAKVRQRFMVRPRTKKILCMKSIPGVVECSRDFVDSSVFSRSSQIMESSFIEQAPPDFSQSMYLTSSKRPNTAPYRRRTLGTDFMGSSPDLSMYSEPGPVELFSGNRLHPQAGPPKLPHNGSILGESFNKSLSTITESEHNSTPKVLVSGEVSGRPSLIITEETDADESINLSSEGSTYKETTSTPVSSVRKKSLPMSPLHQSFSRASVVESEGPLVSSTSALTEDGTDEGRVARGSHGSIDPVMWLVTNTNMLYFYPTTNPSHKPFNSVRLHARATCMEFIKDKVFMGHSDSTISVYYIDEFSHTWDVENPERISLPSSNVKEAFDVQCIAAVGKRIWVGVGPSIFFLDAELPSSREGSIFLDSWRRRPRQILPLGEIVVVTTTSACLYIFDAVSTNLVQKINISYIAKLLDLPEVRDPMNNGSPHLKPPVISRVVSDDTNLYIGTSSGKIVAVPITSLVNLRPKSTDRTDYAVDIPRSVSLSPTRMSRSNESPDETDGLLSARKKKKKKLIKEKEDIITAKVVDDGWEELCTAEQEDKDGPYLENTAISLHSVNDSEVLGLIQLKLPENQITKLKAPVDPVPYHSMPDLNSSFSERVPISPPIVTYKTLILSAGRGHMEYTEEHNLEAIEESSALRERNEAFQLLAWGHKNVLP